MDRYFTKFSYTPSQGEKWKNGSLGENGKGGWKKEKKGVGIGIKKEEKIRERR